MRNKFKKAALAVVALLAPAAAMAAGEPGAEVLTAVQTGLEGTISILIGGIGVLAVAALGIWAGPFIVRRFKSAVNKSS